MSVKKLIFTVVTVLMGLSSLTVHADAPLKEKDYSWMENIRTGHPRMFLTKEDLPQIRKTAFSFEKQTYDDLKKRVDSKIGRPIVFEDPLTPTGEGKENRNWGFYAADAAMMWLITQNPKYLDFF